jgi:hypothetical protein
MSIATIVIRIVQPPGHPICCSNVCYYSKVLLNLYVISCFVIPANAGTYKPCGAIREPSAYNHDRGNNGYGSYDNRFCAT